jgi:hypothetical protein
VAAKGFRGFVTHELRRHLRQDAGGVHDQRHHRDGLAEAGVVRQNT